MRSNAVDATSLELQTMQPPGVAQQSVNDANCFIPGHTSSGVVVAVKASDESEATQASDEGEATQAAKKRAREFISRLKEMATPLGFKHDTDSIQHPQLDACRNFSKTQIPMAPATCMLGLRR